ncbi:hypothetical protein Hanom_Chr15g01383841 [Helianthus anomalus]
MIGAGVDTLVPIVVGTTDRNCQEVYGKVYVVVVQKETAEVPTNPDGGAFASNSKSRDLVTAGEAGMVVT